MDKAIAHIFDTTHCLSPAEMMDYVQGKLSAEERYRIEAHLNSCSFCSEAIDGLIHIKDPDGFSTALQHLHSHLKKQIRSRHKLFMKSYRSLLYLVLVIVIILAILLFTFYLVHFTMLKHSLSQLHLF